MKTTLVGGQCGDDAGKSVKGRKGHILVDTLGLLLAVVVHRADSDGRRGAGLVRARLHTVRVTFPRLKAIVADGGYRGAVETQVKKGYTWLLEILRKPFRDKMFVVFSKRWIVERTLAWLTTQRRLRVEYEQSVKVAEAMIQPLRRTDGHDSPYDSTIIKFRQSLIFIYLNYLKSSL